jgi:YVTN family beta-propeller protein
LKPGNAGGGKEPQFKTDARRGEGVTNYSNGTVSVISAATNTVTTTIPVGITPYGGPHGLAANLDGSKIYVANYGAGTVAVIDTTTNTVTATIAVGNFPFGVAVTPDGSTVYVVNAGDNDVSLIATATNTPITTIAVGSSPVASGIFIQPPPRFAGTPGKANCYGQSVAALARQFHGLADAAEDLGLPTVRALQTAILAFCQG